MNGSQSQTQSQTHTHSNSPLTLTLNLNPELARLPERLPRYRHESHRHRLFAVLSRLNNHTCDNSNCRKNIGKNKPMFSCIQCTFDLCGRCFSMPASNPTPLVGDDRIRDLIKIDPMSLLDVEIRADGESDLDSDGDNDDNMIYNSIPSVPAIENICSVCQVQTQLLHLHCHHICCFVCYQQIDKCPVCRAKRIPRLVKRVFEIANGNPSANESANEMSDSTSAGHANISDTNYNEPD